MKGHPSVRVVALPLYHFRILMSHRTCTSCAQPSDPKKTLLLLLSQACQARLGMTKRVREGSITLNDHDSQSLDVDHCSRLGLTILCTTIVCVAFW